MAACDKYPLLGPARNARSGRIGIVRGYMDDAARVSFDVSLDGRSDEMWPLREILFIDECDSAPDKEQIASSMDAIELSIRDAWCFGSSVLFMANGDDAFDIGWERRDINSSEDGSKTIESADLVEKLKSIGIEKWKPDYQPEGYMVMDGMSWDVSVYSGAKCFTSSGTNAWPQDLKKLLALLAPFIPKSIVEPMSKWLE